MFVSGTSLLISLFSIIVKLVKLHCMPSSPSLTWKRKAAVELEDYHIQGPYLSLHPLRHLVQQLQYLQINQTKMMKLMRNVRYSRSHIYAKVSKSHKLIGRVFIIW